MLTPIEDEQCFACSQVLSSGARAPHDLTGSPLRNRVDDRRNDPTARTWVVCRRTAALPSGTDDPSGRAFLA